MDTLCGMSLSNRQGATQDDKQTAERGTVAVTRDGITYQGSYRVLAEGRGRQRYTVTSSKHVTVTYNGHSKGTSVGNSGLEQTACTLLSELITQAGG